MCGFAGFAGRVSVNDESVSEMLREMGRLISHRGPDHQQELWLKKEGLGLVHCRLSIIDTSERGNQPMWSACRRYLIAYNGEVYNFRSIRSELEARDRHFLGRSDTEVILAAISEWGLESALSRFVGMFAFVLWDAQRRELTLARDRFGIKPLYYSVFDGKCLFGSEIKPLKIFPGWRNDINRDALSEFLKLGYVPSPRCIYASVHKLPPGHLLRLKLDDGSVRPAEPVPYWSLSEVLDRAETDVPDSEDEVLERLKFHLSEAVKSRMVSDVPLGAFLSGGVDSTIVAMFMQAEASTPIKTFSIGVNDPAYDEARHAKEVANFLGTDHTERYIEEKDLLDLIPRLPYFFDEPFADSSQLPTMLLAETARDKVTVVLSGDGGDELFAGYYRHIEAERLSHLIGSVPAVLRTSLARVVESLTVERWSRAHGFLARVFPGKFEMSLPGVKAHKFARALGASDIADLYLRLISQGRGDSLVVDGSCGVIGDWWPRPSRKLSVAEEFMFRDSVGYLPDDILTKVDRSTMAVGLEARVPFLDHRLQEFVWGLPIRFKMKRGVGKYLTRKLLESSMPSHLWDRHKMGFGVPIGEFLRGPLRQWVDDLLAVDGLRRDGFLQPNEICDIWSRHRSGKLDASFVLWNIVVFQSWLHYCDSPGEVDTRVSVSS